MAWGPYTTKGRPNMIAGARRARIVPGAPLTQKRASMEANPTKLSSGAAGWPGRQQQKRERGRQ